MSQALEINHSKEPIRLFKSDFLEFFTHVSPIAILVLWIPVVIYFIIHAILQLENGQSWAYIPSGIIVGLFLWTITEYILHRFLFHFHARTAKGQRIMFLFHGVHHAQPQMKTRLVMPPIVSIPLAALFLGLFYLLFTLILKAPLWLDPVFAGFMIGYLMYDMIHYATHHFAMRKGYWKYIKRYHMAHHFKSPDALFGVSNPVWDYVFHTKPKSNF